MSRRNQRVSLDGLRVLDAIERLGSFSAAAQELCVVTSAVTHTVRNLEEQLGLTLFDRSGRRARFTRDGGLLLRKGRQLLSQAAQFDREVQLIATGWEPQITLCVDQVISTEPFVPLVESFLSVAPQTSLHVRREAAAGTWDALLSGRADLVVGAPADGPPGGGYESAQLYRIKFVLVVAPAHPLAQIAGIIADQTLAQHRAVVIGDTTRHLPHLRYGLMASRLVLSVPDTETKLRVLLLGLGCGFLPQRLAQAHLREGRLVELRVETPPPPSKSTLAWRAGENGRALRWWIRELTEPGVAERLFF
jgi:DNA-binding transcriptional LysR family regulator